MFTFLVSDNENICFFLVDKCIRFPNFFHLQGVQTVQQQQQQTAFQNPQTSFQNPQPTFQSQQSTFQNPQPSQFQNAQAVFQNTGASSGGGFQQPAAFQTFQNIPATSPRLDISLWFKRIPKPKFFVKIMIYDLCYYD